MRKRISKTGVLFFSCFIAFLLQGCASTGSIDNESHIYSQPLNRMANIVEYAIKSSNLDINHIFKSDDETKITFLVGTEVLLGNTMVQQEQGKVIVTELENGRVHVEVENPEYHYTVPHHKREKYDRRIYDRINTILYEKGLMPKV